MNSIYIPGSPKGSWISCVWNKGFIGDGEGWFSKIIVPFKSNCYIIYFLALVIFLNLIFCFGGNSVSGLMIGFEVVLIFYG